MFSQGKMLCVFHCQGCSDRTPQPGWLINIRNVFLTVLEVESLRSRYQHGGVRTLFQVSEFLLCHHMVEGARKPSGASFIRALTPSWGLHPQGISPFQRPHLLISTIALGVGISTWVLGHKHSAHRVLYKLAFTASQTTLKRRGLKQEAFWFCSQVWVLTGG